MITLLRHAKSFCQIGKRNTSSLYSQPLDITTTRSLYTTAAGQYDRQNDYSKSGCRNQDVTRRRKLSRPDNSVRELRPPLTEYGNCFSNKTMQTHIRARSWSRDSYVIVMESIDQVVTSNSNNNMQRYRNS